MRRTLNQWVVLLMTVAVGAAAFQAISLLRGSANASHEVTCVLDGLESQAHALDAIEWRAIAHARVDARELGEFQRRTTAMRRTLEDFRRGSAPAAGLRTVRDASRRYLEAIAAEIRLLEAGEIAGAVALAETRVDPAFAGLDRAIHAATAEQESRATRGHRVAERGTAFTLLLALLMIGLLHWRGEKVRRRAEAAAVEQRTLETGEERFRSLVQNVSDAIAVLLPDRTISYVTPSALPVLGYRPEDLVGTDAFDLVHPEDYRRAWHYLLRCLARAEQPNMIEVRLRHRDGDWCDVEVAVNNCLETPGIGGVVVTVRDISARRHAEEALRESEERYRLLFDRNPQPMWVFDIETLRFLSVNEATVAHYGYSREEFLAMTATEIRPAEDVGAFRARVAALEDGLVRAGVWKHVRKDGSLIEMDIVAHRLELGGRRVVLTLATDVTEKRRLEAEYRQALKMEAVGRLAGGIAHDFNNLMTAVLGYSQLLMNDLHGQPALRARVEEIHKAGERAATLTRQLLAFSRKQVLQPAVVDLKAVVQGMSGLLQRLIGEDVQLVTALAARLEKVKVDPGQMDQVLMNLAVNARDAMPAGGTLTIETANVELAGATERDGVTLEPGSYVMLAVSDTGCGMTPEVRARIFEPFFTTKGTGKGTGLGLAMVYGIVRQSGGHVWVYSESGQGTTFKIYLPCHAAEVSGDAPAPEEKPGRGAEIILLVEDEPQVRGLAREVLAGQGYRVLEAADGPEALMLSERFSGAIHLLVTDVVMPRMNGRELAESLAKQRPEMKLLYTSGYTDRGVVESGTLGGDAAFLQKPFTPDSLARKVRELLDAA
ncbi:MAG: PAS domain S-box protein [Candidatus Eisenbacteria bacterium]|nr:PAS domain S-box protein [Candidatus Eisenbacteria bacterium]